MGRLRDCICNMDYLIAMPFISATLFSITYLHDIDIFFRTLLYRSKAKVRHSGTNEVTLWFGSRDDRVYSAYLQIRSQVYPGAGSAVAPPGMVIVEVPFLQIVIHPPVTLDGLEVVVDLTLVGLEVVGMGVLVTPAGGVLTGLGLVVLIWRHW